MGAEADRYVYRSELEASLADLVVDTYMAELDGSGVERDTICIHNTWNMRTWVVQVLEGFQFPVCIALYPIIPRCEKD